MVSKLNLSIDIIAINKNNHLCLEIEPSSDLYVYKLREDTIFDWLLIY